MLGLHAKYDFELSRVYRDSTRMLRIKHRAVDHRRLIITTVIVLQLRLDLSLLYVLFEEARELRNLGVIRQLGHVYVREIELVGNKQRLLLVHARLGSYGPHEQVFRVRPLCSLTACAVRPSFGLLDRSAV